MFPVFVFFLPGANTLAPECRECGPCGCSSHSDTGLRPAGPLTGSTRQPSWRVAPGSVPRPDGQRFLSDDREADARSIWLFTRGPSDLVRRCHGLSGGAGASTMQPHCVQVFLPAQCGSLSVRWSTVPVALSSPLPGSPVHRYTPANSFQSAPVGVFPREDAQ